MRLRVGVIKGIPFRCIREHFIRSFRRSSICFLSFLLCGALSRFHDLTWYPKMVSALPGIFDRSQQCKVRPTVNEKFHYCRALSYALANRKSTRIIEHSAVHVYSVYSVLHCLLRHAKLHVTTCVWQLYECGRRYLLVADFSSPLLPSSSSLVHHPSPFLSSIVSQRLFIYHAECRFLLSLVVIVAL